MGTGGGDETTGYMGVTLSADGRGILICYDRTVSHARAAAAAAVGGEHDASGAASDRLDSESSSRRGGNHHDGKSRSTGPPMHYNTVYCFRLSVDPAASSSETA